VSIRVDQLELVPSPLDNTQLRCSGSILLASGTDVAPAGPAVAIRLRVVRGRVAELWIDDKPIQLAWSISSPAFVAATPAGAGFQAFDSNVCFENASLIQE
jgi:hypothetical protein